MSFTKPIVNAIYHALNPHEKTVRRVQALFLWNRPVYSVIFFIFIESLFVFAYFLPFSWSCNLCLIVGGFIFFYCLYSAFPSVFDRLIAFEIKEVPKDATNRIRSVPEIAAFLTTAISFWTKFIENLFVSARSSSIYDAVITVLSLLAVFIFTFFVGDLSLIWIIFHSIFVLPPILVLPSVQHLFTEAHNEKFTLRPQRTEGTEKSSDGNEVPPSESETMQTEPERYQFND